MTSADLLWPYPSYWDLIWPQPTSCDLIWPMLNPLKHWPIAFDPMWPHVTSCVMWEDIASSILTCPQPTSGDLSQPHVTLAILMGPQQPFCDLSRPLLIIIDRLWPQLNSYDLSWSLSSVSDPDSLNLDPAKNLNPDPDPGKFVTLTKNFMNFFFTSDTGNSLKKELRCVELTVP